MGKEIEKKFLIKDHLKLQEVLKTKYASIKNIHQGYISFDPQVRIRLVEEKDYQHRHVGTSATLTIKSKGFLERDEYEYNIPVADAQQLIKTVKHKLIKKTRYTFLYNKLYWEVDFFITGTKPAEFADLIPDLPPEHTGFWLAEVELPSADYELELPDWLGEEVTFDPKYQNINMAQNG